MKELFGHIIKSVWLDKDKQFIGFTIAFTEGMDSTSSPQVGKFYLYEATGDCCSQSWFESINGLENLINNKVTGVIEKQINRIESEDETLQIYGITLTTSSGYCDIEYRNESNGYYGGDCELRNNYSVNAIEDNEMTIKFNSHPEGRDTVKLLKQ